VKRVAAGQQQRATHRRANGSIELNHINVCRAHSPSRNTSFKQAFLNKRQKKGEWTMKTFLAAMALTAATSIAALAQSAAPPPEGPTIVQCKSGYQAWMPWTRAEFADACAKLRDAEKP